MHMDLVYPETGPLDQVDAQNISNSIHMLLSLAQEKGLTQVGDYSLAVKAAITSTDLSSSETQRFACIRNKDTKLESYQKI